MKILVSESATSFPFKDRKEEWSFLLLGPVSALGSGGTALCCSVQVDFPKKKKNATFIFVVIFCVWRGLLPCPWCLWGVYCSGRQTALGGQGHQHGLCRGAGGSVGSQAAVRPRIRVSQPRETPLSFAKTPGEVVLGGKNLGRSWVVAGWGVGGAKGLLLVGQRAAAGFGNPCLRSRRGRMLLGQLPRSDLRNLFLGVTQSAVMAPSASGPALCRLQSLPPRPGPNEITAEVPRPISPRFGRRIFQRLNAEQGSALPRLTPCRPGSEAGQWRSRKLREPRSESAFPVSVRRKNQQRSVPFAVVGGSRSESRSWRVGVCGERHFLMTAVRVRWEITPSSCPNLPRPTQSFPPGSGSRGSRPQPECPPLCFPPPPGKNKALGSGNAAGARTDPGDRGVGAEHQFGTGCVWCFPASGGARLVEDRQSERVSP